MKILVKFALYYLKRHSLEVDEGKLTWESYQKDQLLSKELHNCGIH